MAISRYIGVRVEDGLLAATDAEVQQRTARGERFNRSDVVRSALVERFYPPANHRNGGKMRRKAAA